MNLITEIQTWQQGISQNGVIAIILFFIFMGVLWYITEKLRVAE